MNEFPLKKNSRFFDSNRIGYMKKSAPFVENKYAVLIHRPISIEFFHLKLFGRVPHVGIHYLCGNTSNGDQEKFTLLDSVPEGKVVCARCEEAAIASGLPSSSELSGRHICIGGVKAVSFCCGEKSNA